MFSVIETKGTDGQKEVSEVPNVWIRANRVYWPKSQVTRKARAQELPKKDWQSGKFKYLKQNIGNL